MNEARPYASLSSGLLARKGAAKPAMRPQGFGGFEDLGWNDMCYGPGEAPAAEAPEHVPSSIAALTPAPKGGRVDLADYGEEGEDFAPEQSMAEETAQARPVIETPPVVEPEPAPEVQQSAEIPEEVAPVVAQQRAILERFEGELEDEAAQVQPVPARPRRSAKAQVVSLPKRKPVSVGGRKAAFTLRLDADRHLRLRLACAVTGRSAQQIVAGALDEALAAIPEIESLAARVPAAGAKRN